MLMTCKLRFFGIFFCIDVVVVVFVIECLVVLGLNEQNLYKYSSLMVEPSLLLKVDWIDGWEG